MGKHTRALLLVCGAALLLVLGTPRGLPIALKIYEPEIIFRGSSDRKVIYLTIDDAPTGKTADILAALARHKVHATFFIIADRVKSDADLEAIIAAGHELGHHMRTTKSAPKIEWENFKVDFDSTDVVLRKFTKPKFFRPPSGFATKRQLNYVIQQGYRPITGTVFPLDHWIEKPSVLSALIRWLAVPGGNPNPPRRQ